MVVATDLDLVWSKVRSKIKSIIFSSKKHHVVGQLVLENRETMLVNRAETTRGVMREDKGSRSRGMVVVL